FTKSILYNFSFSIHYLPPFVAKIEIKLSIRPEDEGVHPVIMLFPVHTLKNNFLFVSFIVPVRICEKPYIRALGDNDFIAHHPDAQWGIKFRSLIKYRAFITDTIAIRILQYDNAVTFRIWVVSGKFWTVIEGFANPYPP